MVDTQLDPDMDMTPDMDLVKGESGISYWFTNLDDFPKNIFTKYTFGKSFLDIGCGDGRMVRLARMSGASKYRGIDVDGSFFIDSSIKRYLKQADFRDVDLTRFNVLYYFLGSVEKIPLDKKGEPEFMEFIKNFKGVLILYHRKVTHRLDAFQKHLINIGFEKIEEEGYIRIYRK